MKEFWQDRWDTDRLGWHSGDVNPHLVRHADKLLGPPQSNRVLVPLCGKTVDLQWIADRGDVAIGVEIIELAAQQFFEERGIAPRRDETASGLTRYSADRIEIICADFFDVKSEDVGDLTGVWDRAALVALPADVRQRYRDSVRALTGGPILLDTFTYDQSLMEGPPYSIEESEVMGGYGSRTIERLSRENVIDRVPFTDRGFSEFFESVFFIS